MDECRAILERIAKVLERLELKMFGDNK